MLNVPSIQSGLKKNTWTNFKSSQEQILKVVKIVNKNSQLKYIYHFSTIILIKYYLKQYFAHQFSSIKLALFSILIINAGFDALKWASIFQQW